MREFLEDFGLVAADGDERRLFCRGYGDAPVLHIAEQGEPGFAGFGLRAARLDDLHTLAHAEGVAVEPLEAPGGGYRVTLRDPDGNAVEIVAGQAPVAPLPLPARMPWNSSQHRERLRATKRL